MKALRRVGEVCQSRKHYDVVLLDRLYDVCDQLGIADRVLPAHRRTRSGPPVVEHGSHYGVLNAVQVTAAAASVELTPPVSSAQYIDPLQHARDAGLQVLRWVY